METPAKGIRWNLSDLYSGIKDPHITKDKKVISSLTKAFIIKFKGKINSPALSAPFLLKALKDVEEIDEKIYIYLNFASYLYAQDSMSDSNRKFYEQAEEFATLISAQLTWFMLEWQKLEDKTAKRILGNPLLKNYHHFLTHARIFAKFRLTEPEEIIMTKKSMTGADAFVRFYDETSSAQAFDLEIEGKIQKLNYSQISAIIKSHPNRTLRKKAAEVYSQVFKEHAHFYTFTLNNLLLEKKVNDEIRGYNYPQQATFLSYEVNPQIVNSLITSVSKRYTISHRFYKAKARLQNYDTLYEWDRYSPVYPDASQKYSWNEAQMLVLEAFEAFSPQFCEIAELFFKNGWIDAEVTPNKRGGAFCSYNVPSKHPYVLLNFTGEVDDVSTLAHELGHAIHAYVSRDNTLLQFYPSTATAEIASVFCESILFDKLFSNTQDKKVKLNLLANKIQGSFATIFRQSAFYNFETKIHEHRRKNGTVSIEDFNKYFQQTLKPMFGNSLTLTEDHAYWWMPILHFYHYNFYVFTYAFGEALTNALYAAYKQQGSSFVKNYTEALQLGGSKAPDEIVKIMGKNIADPNFWDEGLDLLDLQVKDFEILAKQA